MTLAESLARRMFAGENASSFDAMPEWQRDLWIGRAQIALATPPDHPGRVSVPAKQNPSAFVSVAPGGEPYWPSAQPTPEASRRVCFGPHDDARLDDLTRKGWRCLPVYVGATTKAETPTSTPDPITGTDDPGAGDKRAERPKIGASVLCEHDGRLLLGLAAAPSSVAGLWQPPAGGVEFGEPVQAAALRELREEAGINARITGLAGITEMLKPDAGKHKVIVTYHGLADSPVARPNDEFNELRWFTPLEVAALAQAGSLTAMTAEVLAGTRWSPALAEIERLDRSNSGQGEG